MPKSPELVPTDRPRRPRPRRRGALLMAAAGLMLAAAAACASMTSLTHRTAESPAEPWVPPAREAKPAAVPPSAPDIPADLRAPGRAWTLGDIVTVGLANNPQTRAAWNAARAASAGVSLSLGEYLPQAHPDSPRRQVEDGLPRRQVRRRPDDPDPHGQPEPPALRFRRP